MTNKTLNDFTGRVLCPTCGGAGTILNIDQVSAGINVIRRRRKAGVRQQKLAKLLGISQAYLCDLEHGKRRWSNELFETAMKLLPEEK